MFGSHLSIAGGMHNALLSAEKYGMDTVQVFTKNQQQWKCRPLDSGVIGQWCCERDRLKFKRLSRTGRTKTRATVLPVRTHSCAR